MILEAPIDVQAVVGNRNTYANRRVLRNGQLSAAPSTAWTDEVHTRTGTWSASDPRRITGLSNVADIPLGALVTAPQGVGREIYVTAKDVAGGRVTLSGALLRRAGDAGLHLHPVPVPARFHRLQNLQRFIVSDIEFLCAGACSGLNMPLERAGVPDPGTVSSPGPRTAASPRRAKAARGCRSTAASSSRTNN